MDFLFFHDGHTYAKHTECREGETAQVRCDQADPAPAEEPRPLEPSGDSE